MSASLLLSMPVAPTLLQIKWATSIEGGGAYLTRIGAANIASRGPALPMVRLNPNDNKGRTKQGVG